jgi:purine-binding chemotaxis protein CheW
MSATRQFCSFMVDDLSLGLDVSRVQEVVRHHDVTRVPLAAKVIRGLINLRGQIVLAIDLRRCLAKSERPDGQRAMNVVLRSDAGPISLLVDRIGDVVEVDDRLRQPPPETLRESARKLIDAAYPLPGRILLSLDADAVVEMSGRQ